MANAGRPIVGVRVGVKNGGCAGMAYTMEYAEKVGPSDEVVEDKGVRVLIDPKAVLFLLGTEMGYKVEKLAAQFVFNNLRLRRIGATHSGYRNALISTRHADGVCEMLAVSLLKTQNPRETPGFLWLSEF